MASEDWFLRLDPYNFDSEEDFLEFSYNDIKSDIHYLKKIFNKLDCTEQPRKGGLYEKDKKIKRRYA